MSAATKKVKKVDARSRTQLDAAIVAYERYNDFTLMDALAGEFHIDLDVQAAAAFTVADVAQLNKLAAKIECPVDFIEPSTVLKKAAKNRKPIKLDKGGTRPFTERDFTPGERHAILRAHDGTRAHARDLLDANGGGTPFDD